MQAGKLKSDLEDAVAGLIDAHEYHLSHDYYMFPAIRVAEFLDVEVFHTIPLAKWKELRGGDIDFDGKQNLGLIANFLLEKDTISPAELARRVAAAAPTQRTQRSRAAAPTVPRLSEEDQALFDLNEERALSDVNPLHEEIRKYISMLRICPTFSTSEIA